MVKKPNVMQYTKLRNSSVCMHLHTDERGDKIKCNDCDKSFIPEHPYEDLPKHAIEELDKCIDSLKYFLPMIHNKHKQEDLSEPIKKFARWVEVLQKELPELCKTIDTLIKANQEV